MKFACSNEIALAQLALRMRRHVVKMVHAADASHVGSALSMADILAVLYGRILKIDRKNPNWNERDRLIVSKGHGAAALYAVLAEMGYFPLENLGNFGSPDSYLSEHVTAHGVPGVDWSTGSLGHGLSVGCGMAFAGKSFGNAFRVFVILSDGELNEGSCWEAIMFAAHHGLDNLTAIVDRNKWQGFGKTADIINLDPLHDKWKAFGWETVDVDGHSIPDLGLALSRLPCRKGKPTCVIAETTKGKGVSFMEDRLEWHYRSPDDQQLEKALAQLQDPSAPERRCPV